MFSSGDCYPTADMVDFSESATKYAGFDVFWFCKPLTQLCTCYLLCPLEMRVLCLKWALSPIILHMSKPSFGMEICFKIVSWLFLRLSCFA